MLRLLLCLLLAPGLSLAGKPNKATVSISSVPSSINAGGSATNSWASQNATACALGGAWSGSAPVNGSAVVSPFASSTYAITCSGKGAGSATASTTVTVLAPPPPPPTAVLSWGGSVGATGYRVYYGTVSGTYFQPIEVGDVLTYTVTGLQSRTQYFFIVTAFNTGGESLPSNEVSKLTP